MQNIDFTTPMATADTFVFPVRQTSQRQILELSGAFGGLTATIGYIDPAGTFVAFKASIGGSPVTATAADGFVVEVPFSGQFAIMTTGTPSGAGIKLTASTAAP